MTTATMSNPFGVMDVPNAFDPDVLAFEGSASLEGSAADENAEAWPRTAIDRS